jgi:hypothetical protein
MGLFALPRCRLRAWAGRVRLRRRMSSRSGGQAVLRIRSARGSWALGRMDWRRACRVRCAWFVFGIRGTDYGRNRRCLLAVELWLWSAGDIAVAS